MHRRLRRTFQSCAIALSCHQALPYPLAGIGHHDGMLRGGDGCANWLPVVQVKLDIVSSAQRVCATETEQVGAASNDGLLDARTGAKAEIMQSTRHHAAYCLSTKCMLP